MAARPQYRGSPRPTRADEEGDGLDQWCGALETAYPAEDAASWDAIGLHVGDLAADRVTAVLVTLDITEEVLDEAASLGADLIIAHHPLLFSPLARLTGATAPGRLALQAARQGCAVVAAHTNIDAAANGTSHPVADVLGLVDRRPLSPLEAAEADRPVKLVTFVPRAHTDDVIEAMSSAGAGQVGEYTGCAFVAPGVGRFTPGEESSPSVGSVGEAQEVSEDRVEMVLRAGEVEVVVAELLAAHPYEEVPFDVWPLRQSAAEGSEGRPDAFADGAKGLGVRGRLVQPTPLREVADALRDGLPSRNLRMATSDPEMLITDVAVCGGAGDSFIPRLIDDRGKPTVDVFVTGDLKHHVALDALTLGLSLIDAGHFATENPAMDAVVDRLESLRTLLSLTAPIHRSTMSTDPWTNWRIDT